LENKNFDWIGLGVATIGPRSLKTIRSKNIFKDRPKHFLFLKSYMTLFLVFIFANNRFSKKLDPLTTTGMALCVNLGPKCQI
jgi:hypothetical protein